jgi:Protein of unknown function, DUF481
MKLLKSLIVVVLLVASILPSGAVYAQKSQPMPWWSNSSYVAIDTTNRVQFHSEIEYSYETQSGNLEGSEHDGKFLVALRKNHLTNYIMIRSNHYDYKIIPDNQEVTQEQYKIDDILRFDINKLFFIDAGFYIEKNSDVLLDRRTAVYGALGIYTRLPYKTDLNFTIGAGNDTKDYDPVIPLETETNLNIYYTVSINSMIRPYMVFSTKIRLQHISNDTESYEFMSESSLMFPVTRSVSLGYIFDWDVTNKPWPGVLRANTHQAFGIQLQF